MELPFVCAHEVGWRHVGQGWGGKQAQGDGEGAHGYMVPRGDRKKSPASPFPHPSNGLALIPAQRLERQPRSPQVRLVHGDRRLSQRLGHAVIGLPAPRGCKKSVTRLGVTRVTGKIDVVGETRHWGIDEAFQRHQRGEEDTSVRHWGS